MVNEFHEKIVAELDAALALRSSWRAMRVTMECGHMRLSPHMDAVGGIGMYTACRVCSEGKEDQVSRQVVNVEETGTLHESWVEGVIKKKP